MSIYRLGSDVWENILRYLEASDIIKLLSSGDNIIRTRLKQAIRDWRFCVRSLKPPSLSSLLMLIKESSSKPRLLSIGLGTWYHRLRFVSEDYTVEKWQTFFPSNLEALQLTVECQNPPVSSLLASLATLAPSLKRLRILNVANRLALPALTFLEIDASISWAIKQRQSILSDPNFIESLPTTLTHLKFGHRIVLRYERNISRLPFRNMPLTLFCGKIFLPSLTKDQEDWSIFPPSISHLSAELWYGGENRVRFGPPKNPSWKQLFPGLTSLIVPFRASIDASYLKSATDALDGPIFEKQIEEIRSTLPASLTNLYLPSEVYNTFKEDYTLIFRAIGANLRTFDSWGSRQNSSVLKWLPKWENPRVSLLKTVMDPISNLSVLAEDENFENFVSEKKSSNFPALPQCNELGSRHIACVGDIITTKNGHEFEIRSSAKRRTLPSICLQSIPTSDYKCQQRCKCGKFPKIRRMEGARMASESDEIGTLPERLATVTFR